MPTFSLEQLRQRIGSPTYNEVVLEDALYK